MGIEFTIIHPIFHDDDIYIYIIYIYIWIVDTNNMNMDLHPPFQLQNGHRNDAPCWAHATLGWAPWGADRGGQSPNALSFGSMIQSSFNYVLTCINLYYLTLYVRDSTIIYTAHVGYLVTLCLCYVNCSTGKSIWIYHMFAFSAYLYCIYIYMCVCVCTCCARTSNLAEDLSPRGLHHRQGCQWCGSHRCSDPGRERALLPGGWRHGTSERQMSCPQWLDSNS